MMQAIDAKVEKLIERIGEDFQKGTFPKRLVAYGSVDADRISTILQKDWWEVTIADISACGSDEIVLLLNGEGLLYYLPAFLCLLLKHRDFGWFEEILLPAHPDFRDTVEFFSGGTLQDGGFDSNSKAFYSRVRFVHKSLNNAQRQCVAQYLEIAEQHSFRYPEADSDFARHLARLLAFWSQEGVGGA